MKQGRSDISRRHVLGGAAIATAATAAGALVAAPAAAAATAAEDVSGLPLGGPYLLDRGSAGPLVAWCTEPAPAVSALLVGEAVASMTDARLGAAATGRASRGRGWSRVAASTTRLMGLTGPVS